MDPNKGLLSINTGVRVVNYLLQADYSAIEERVLLHMDRPGEIKFHYIEPYRPGEMKFYYIQPAKVRKVRKDDRHWVMSHPRSQRKR